MMKRSLFTLALAAASQLPAGGAAWLSYPQSARAVAEAGGLGVLSEGLHAVGSNPAGLAELPGAGQLQLSHSGWAADIRSENLGVASQSAFGAVALSGTWVDFGGIQGYGFASNGSLQATQTLHPSAGALHGTWAHQVFSPGISLGVGLSVLQQDLDGTQSAQAFAGDAGLKAELGAGFTGALSLLNAGSQLGGSDLPTELRAGLAWSSSAFPVSLGVELAGQRGASSSDVRSALRLRLAEGLQARLGFAQLAGAAPEASLGFSFTVAGRWDLDYAFRQQADLGATHHIGLGFRWS
jgi:hypothetical protein